MEAYLNKIKIRIHHATLLKTDNMIVLINLNYIINIPDVNQINTKTIHKCL